MAEFVLFHTSACHLCEQAQSLLADANRPVRLVDIANDSALIDRYGIRIPVLRHEATDRELDWPFDKADILAFFDR